MREKASPRVIGAFVLGGIALAVIVLVVFGSAELFVKKMSFVVYFEGDVMGLRQGSPVKVRGIDIGTVSKITPLYDQEGDFLIEVVIKVSRRMLQTTMGDFTEAEAAPFMDQMVERGLRARLESQSLLTGLKYIKFDIFPGHPVGLRGLNKDHYEIPSIKTTQEEIQTVLSEALDRIKELDFERMASRLEAAMDRFGSTLSAIDGLVNSPELKETLSGASESMKVIKSLSSSLEAVLDPSLGDKMNALLSNLGDASKALTGALERGEQVLARMEKVTVDEQYELQIMIDKLAKSSRAVRLLIDQIQREPRSFIFGKN